ncbi:nucleoside triphosphate pyrophosphohydrolase family protein, partial [Patescibacteria group bacterium]|nr:nucleoside triphosphate pyrophosphohydrolase family protein [Patescibacteria group bacterium]
MNLDDYQKMVKKTAAKYRSKEKTIMTWGLGIAGEAGDVAGCIKKTYSHNDDQKKGIKENLGDTMWYIAMICNFYGWSLDELLDENIKKLSKR